jgi:hypothetical protein
VTKFVFDDALNQRNGSLGIIQTRNVVEGLAACFLPSLLELQADFFNRLEAVGMKSRADNV